MTASYHPLSMKKNLSIIIILPLCMFVSCTRSTNTFIQKSLLYSYVDHFNLNDDETVVNFIPNSEAKVWLSENIPLFECPDKDIEEIYYFRWWTFRKHIKYTEDGFIITEFLPQVSWSTKHNAINCPAGHHFREGRWIHDRKYLDDYAKFWFNVPGVVHTYSFWAANSIYEYYLVSGDKALPVNLLDSLVRFYQTWGKNRLYANGLFWQIDSHDGTEHSIAGSGCRPTINSYMYGDAVAISKIAHIAGKNEISEEYKIKADKLQKLVEEKLWDQKQYFFKTMRFEDLDQKANYDNLSIIPCKSGELADVKEIFGYIPWYFELPEKGKGYEYAWRLLMDPKGFWAPYGPTTAEQIHPNFRNDVIGCTWDGPSWPFSTSQTLTALANVLNDYPQDVITKGNYFELLKIYTKSHRITLEDGRVVPWIDESLVPSTGEWGTRTALIQHYPDQIGRGKDYNHSTYCDLIITGLIGFRPQEDNSIVINPLIPDSWEYFCLENVLYKDHIITVVYDKTGKKYNKGKGLMLYIDRKKIIESPIISSLALKM